MTIYSHFERQANICIANSPGLTVTTAVIRQLTITSSEKVVGKELIDISIFHITNLFENYSSLTGK